jgi:hypothetical protein
VDRASVLVDDLLDDCQTKTRASGFVGSNEGLKNPPGNGGWNAGTGIGNFDADRPRGGSRTDGEAPTLVLHRLNRVADQIVNGAR